MKLTNNVPIKWEAAVWIPAYCFAHMVIAAICKESLRLSPETTSTILVIAGVVLAIIFLAHAKRMSRSYSNNSMPCTEQETTYTMTPLFNEDKDTAKVLFPRRRRN